MREAQAWLQDENGRLMVEIDALRNAMALDRALLRRQGEKLREAEDFAREVAEIVGREAIIAGVPVTLQYEWTRKDRITEFRHEPQQPMPFHLPSAQRAPVEFVRIETMHLLQVDAVAEVMRCQMQIEARLADGHKAIAISGTAIRRMTKDEIYRLLVRPLAEALARQIKGLPA